MDIGFFDIDKVYKEHKEEINLAIEKVLTSGKVLMGPEIEELENVVANYCNRKYAVATGSCTDALFFAITGSGINKGDEVLVTSYSFIASVSPILRIGAIPVFVDIDPNSFMMNLDDLKSKITNKTKAIVAVHLFGQCLPIDELEEIATENNLILIEDAAQSLGSYYNSRSAGSMGIASCISFDPTKVIGAFGNGGILLTDDENMFKVVSKLRYHGKNIETGEFEILGYNSRLSSYQAALLLIQFNHLDSWIEKRNKIAELYNDELKEIDEITVPQVDGKTIHIYHKYVMKVERRDQLKEHLMQNGIKTMIHYKKTLFENELFNQYKYFSQDIIVATKITKQVLSLPIYPSLKIEEIKHITESIKDFYKDGRH